MTRNANADWLAPWAPSSVSLLSPELDLDLPVFFILRDKRCTRLPDVAQFHFKWVTLFFIDFPLSFANELLDMVRRADKLLTYQIKKRVSLCRKFFLGVTHLKRN